MWHPTKTAVSHSRPIYNTSSRQALITKLNINPTTICITDLNGNIDIDNESKQRSPSTTFYNWNNEKNKNYKLHLILTFIFCTCLLQVRKVSGHVCYGYKQGKWVVMFVMVTSQESEWPCFFMVTSQESKRPCLLQARKVSGHVYYKLGKWVAMFVMVTSQESKQPCLLWVSNLSLFPPFFY